MTHDRSLLDINSSGAIDDPFPTLGALRENDPVHWDESMNGWLLTRYADICAAFDHPALSADRVSALRPEIIEAESPQRKIVREHMSRWVVMTDPPVHTRLRGVLRAAFTPRAVRQMEPVVRDVVDELLGELAGRRRVEFVGEVGVQLPGRVIATMMGVPFADIPDLKRFSDELLSSSNRGTAPAVPVAADAIGEMESYFGDLVGRRRARPGDTVTDQLIAAADSSEGLDASELVSSLTFLLFAGLETTTHLLASGLRALLLHPAQLALLRAAAADEAVYANAVNEMLRWHGPVFASWRRARWDLVIGGRSIRAGDNVYLIQLAGNRDPEVFPDPDTFDVRRSNAARHIGFGRGAHYCLGGPLAQLEARITFPRLLSRWPEMTLLGEGSRIGNVIVHGFTTLDVDIGSPVPTLDTSGGDTWR